MYQILYLLVKLRFRYFFWQSIARKLLIISV